MDSLQQNTSPYDTYPGGKSGAGVYQTIINHIPPLRVFMSLFAGNCGVFNNLRSPEWSVINDIDYHVINRWEATGLWVNGNVRFTSKDAVEFLRVDLRNSEYTRLLKHTFIYLDPPYLVSTRKGKKALYNREFLSLEDHNRLLDEVLALPREIKVMISHYECDLYNERLKDWVKVSYKSQTRRGQVMDTIYMNYTLDGSLHDYSYIGQNFREREKFKRIKTNFFLKLDRMDNLLRNSMLQEYELRQLKK